MSTMFVIALDVDESKADAFLQDLQRDRRIRYSHKSSGSASGSVLRTLPLLFVYKTTMDGKCERHEKKLCSVAFATNDVSVAPGSGHDGRCGMNGATAGCVVTRGSATADL